MIIDFESPLEMLQKSHVFISYARKDGNKIANKLETNLLSQGITIWRDRLIKPGVFGTELKAAIDNSFAMIALITPEACKSYWVKCEWCYAISRRNVTIIPVISPDFDENLFPFELFPMSRIYLSRNYNSSIENLVALLNFARDNPPIW